MQDDEEVDAGWEPVPTMEQRSLPTYSDTFLDSFGGRIITVPTVAIVELVANAWDAGATRVDITWPDEDDGTFAIEDNGTGMTHEQFWRRWHELSYKRSQAQGRDVEFPPGAPAGKRVAFGRNGKGRFAVFCFTNDYTLATKRDGTINYYLVQRNYDGVAPYSVDHVGSIDDDGHGTRIDGTVQRNHISTSMIGNELICRFRADPSFVVSLNGEVLRGDDGDSPPVNHHIDVEGQRVVIHVYEGRTSGRLSGFHGVAWWVLGRLVGIPSWNRLGGGAPFADRRTTYAKRFTIVVEADLLEDSVLDDWSGFVESPAARRKISAIEAAVEGVLESLIAESQLDQKLEVARELSSALRPLPSTSRQAVGEFISELQSRVPTISDDLLTVASNAALNILQARSGANLLRKLADLSPTDIDGLDEILSKWTVLEVRLIVEELSRRLDLIKRIEEVVQRRSDELHEVHPLIEKGLWIFGHEFDAVSFESNRQLATVVRRRFGATEEQVRKLSHPTKRPDIVVRVDSTVSCHTSYGYGDDGEVRGIDKVLILELKAGQSRLTRADVNQPQDYAVALREAGVIASDTPVVCYVLGSELGDYAEEASIGRTLRVIPRTYDVLLRLAHARTFDLLKRIEDARFDEIHDSVIEEALSSSLVPLEGV